MTHAVLMDCDNTMGLPFKDVDDGLALIYLLGCTEVQLLGVTTTFGNGPIEQVFEKTQDLIHKFKKTDLPVFRGAAQQGDIQTNAAQFLAQMAAAHPGEISLVATGPLTNLLGAFSLDPLFFQNLRQVICMGGYLQPLRIGWRNVAELNFSADPIAAHTVLQASCPHTIMSAQICLQAPFGWSDLKRTPFLDGKTRVALRNWLWANLLTCGIHHFYLWDLLPVVYLTHPELFEPHPVAIASTAKDLQQGTLVLRPEAPTTLTNLPTQINNPARFKACLYAAWAVASKMATP